LLYIHKSQINQNEKSIINYCNFYLSCCNKTAEVKVKTAYVDTSVLMKEYKAKDLEQNIKHSLKKKGRQLDAESKDSNKMLLIQKAQANGQLGKQKE
jgi:outer membrane protein